MPRIFLYAALSSLLSFPVASSDDYTSPIVGLNFCGTVVQLTRDTLMKSKSDYLTTLLDGKMNSTRDSEGNYFIERPGYEAHFLVKLLTAQAITVNKSNRKNIESFADFFGFISIGMGSQTSTQENTRSIKSQANARKKHRFFVCPECPGERLISGGIKEAEDHLMQKHNVKIITRSDSKKGWNVSYSVDK